MTLEIIGHAIVSAEGSIADAGHKMPAALRNDADWRRFQAALDASALVVLGRIGHEAHPNPGRRRLVVTSRVRALAPDPADPKAMHWNPQGMAFDDVISTLGMANRSIAITGGTRVFDLFLDRLTRFDLVEVAGVSLPEGLPCFSGGPPQRVLAAAGLHPAETEPLDAEALLTVWRR